MCANASETVLVSVYPQNNAGTATDITVCVTDGQYDLFTALSGHDTGGTWLDDDGSAALTGSLVDPGTAGEGTYNFTYVVDNGVCTADSTTVAFTVTPIANAGTATDTTLCESVATFDLFETLAGATAGGTWLRRFVRQ